MSCAEKSRDILRGAHFMAKLLPLSRNALLSQPERQALYERTVKTLESTCMRTPGPAFAAYCQEQAAFLRHFPECSDECRELIARFANKPAR
jgi:hypothetical protein